MKRCAILVVFAALATSGLPADLAVTVGSRHAALVVQDTRFDPAVQLVSDVAIGLAWDWWLPSRPGVFTVEPSLGVGRIGRSRTLDGYFYRGVAVRSLGLELQLAGWPGVGRGSRAANVVGARLTGRAVLASYELTSLLFFYPELELALTLRTRLGERVRIDWAMPLFYQFRRDLAYAFGAGFSTTIALEFSSPGS